MSAVGDRIRALRLQRGLSQRALASQVGVTFPHISKIEAGSESASNELLARIAKALAADPDELFRLAGRLSDELAQFVIDKGDIAPVFLRRWRSGEISDAEVESLLRRRASG